MASTTAEVMLYFQCDDPGFQKTIETLRFDIEPERTTREIIDLLRPVYDAGYDVGMRDAEVYR